MNNKRIIITGAAGLLGQNLVPRLKEAGYNDIVAIDKHPANIKILKRQHSDITVIEADLAVPGSWEQSFAGCHTLVIAHAQIGGKTPESFIRNNVEATKRVLDAAQASNINYIVHISSSVVNSAAVDSYTETKKQQEHEVQKFQTKKIILRPTLMFGWFDRKHLGWLARFMTRMPLFPIPGSGRYLRQPLYVGDFCNVIISAIKTENCGIYNITGQERIYYIDLIRSIKGAVNSNVRIIKIPYSVFWLLLKTFSIFSSDPPFTVTQLKALVTPDVFEVIDWPKIFTVKATPLALALEETFTHPVYAEVVLEF